MSRTSDSDTYTLQYVLRMNCYHYVKYMYCSLHCVYLYRFKQFFKVKNVTANKKVTKPQRGHDLKTAVCLLIVFKFILCHNSQLGFTKSWYSQGSLNLRLIGSIGSSPKYCLANQN